MDDDSGDDDKDWLASGWGDESRQSTEMNLEVDSKDYVMHLNERSVIFEVVGFARNVVDNEPQMKIDNDTLDSRNWIVHVFRPI